MDMILVRIIVLGTITRSPDHLKAHHNQIIKLLHCPIPPNIWKHYSKPWSTVGTARANFLVMKHMRALSICQSLSLQSTQLPHRWTCSNLLPSKAPKSLLKTQRYLSRLRAKTSHCPHYLEFPMALTHGHRSSTSPAANTIALPQSVT